MITNFIALSWIFHFDFCNDISMKIHSNFQYFSVFKAFLGFEILNFHGYVLLKFNESTLFMKIKIN